MFSLPTPISSKYKVGSTTFAASVRPILTFGDAKTSDGRPALISSEVAFTAYYPAIVTPLQKEGVEWVLRPLSESLNGFYIFAGNVPRWILRPIIYLYAAFIKIPVYANASPLHSKGRPWPLVIFSHGLGGSRTAYSQVCQRLAGTGKIVIAVEHRDGTAISCTTREWEQDGTTTQRAIPYLQEEPLTRPPKHQDDTLSLRRDQLEFRRHEIYTAYSTFLSIIRSSNQPPQVQLADGSPVEWSSWTSNGDRPLVECSQDVTLAGHSFGGCTAFHIMCTPPLEGFPSIPISKILIYDPWLEPIPSPGPTPLDLYKLPRRTLNPNKGEDEKEIEDNNILPQLLVINSEAFTLWDDHFERLEKCTLAWRPTATLLTLARSQHPHFSDFLVLPFIPKRKVGLLLMECIDRLSNAFVDGRLKEQLNEEPTREMAIDIEGKRKDGRPKRSLKGAPGDIILH